VNIETVNENHFDRTPEVLAMVYESRSLTNTFRQKQNNWLETVFYALLKNKNAFYTKEGGFMDNFLD